MTAFRWDAFISHASEDKAVVARPLANELATHSVRVWLDEAEIMAGESIRARIDEGLAKSRFGVLIMSPHFLAKEWTGAEIGALFAREMAGSHVLIPVWHNITHGDLIQHSPLLADRLALNTLAGLPAVAGQIVRQLRRESPSYRPGLPIYSGKLRKQVLLELPEGAFLLSNVYNRDYTPKVACLVPAFSEREAFWAWLKAEGISATRFYVFADEAEFREHMSARSIFGIEALSPAPAPREEE